MSSAEHDLFDDLRDLWRAGFSGDVRLSMGKTPEAVSVELVEEGRGPNGVPRLLKERTTALRSRATG